MMDARRIENLSARTGAEWVAAQYDPPLIRNQRIDLFFIVAKHHPVIIRDPAPISGSSQSGMARGESLTEFFAPALDHFLRRVPSIVQIPFIMSTKFEPSLGKMAVEVRNSLPQGTPCFF